MRVNRSSAQGREAIVRALDRNANIYGIRALNSCRARHEHLFYVSLVGSSCIGISGSSGNRQRLSRIAI
jgi:hypothetical protein